MVCEVFPIRKNLIRNIVTVPLEVMLLMLSESLSDLPDSHGSPALPVSTITPDSTVLTDSPVSNPLIY